VFPKSARLLSPHDYRRVFAEPSRSSDRFLVVLGRSNGGAPARLGLAVSRKCSQRAVRRNRLKRLVREVFRRRRGRLFGVDFVVLCRPGVEAQSNRELFVSLTDHFEKVRLRICGTS
jgi:ribonuclease P protein component